MLGGCFCVQIVAGGWQKKGSNYEGDPAVDVFMAPLKGGNGGGIRCYVLWYECVSVTVSCGGYFRDARKINHSTG